MRSRGPGAWGLGLVSENSLYRFQDGPEGSRAAPACFKLGIVLEGTYARAFAGLAPREVGDRLHATTLGLLERARGFMDGDVRG